MLKSASKAAQPVLLSGGNPQIAKGYGDAPVQAYIAAMPGWNRDVGRAFDALIVRTIPHAAQSGENGIRRSTAMKGTAGFSAFIASRVTSKRRSSAARRCSPFRPARRSTSSCATSTSAKMMKLTKRSSRPG